MEAKGLIPTGDGVDELQLIASGWFSADPREGSHDFYAYKRKVFVRVFLMDDVTKKIIHKIRGFRGKDHPNAKASFTYPGPFFCGTWFYPEEKLLDLIKDANNG
jgi:hypothetical protein